MTAELRLHHMMTTEKTEELEDRVKEVIEQEFDEEVNIVSEMTGNELTANPEPNT